MLDNEFDPFDALIKIDQNMQNVIRAHNALAHEVERMSQIIDTLQRGLDAANKANELLLKQGLDTLYTNFTAQGQH